MHKNIKLVLVNSHTFSFQYDNSSKAYFEGSEEYHYKRKNVKNWEYDKDRLNIIKVTMLIIIVIILIMNEFNTRIIWRLKWRDEIKDIHYLLGTVIYKEGYIYIEYSYLFY